jgi:hypothetical protein
MLYFLLLLRDEVSPKAFASFLSPFREFEEIHLKLPSFDCKPRVAHLMAH